MEIRLMLVKTKCNNYWKKLTFASPLAVQGKKTVGRLDFSKNK